MARAIRDVRKVLPGVIKDRRFASGSFNSAPKQLASEDVVPRAALLGLVRRNPIKTRALHDVRSKTMRQLHRCGSHSGLRRLRGNGAQTVPVVPLPKVPGPRGRAEGPKLRGPGPFLQILGGGPRRRGAAAMASGDGGASSWEIENMYSFSAAAPRELVAWSNNRFDNRRFRSSLEAND